MSRIIGTYTYQSYANRGKVQKIKQILTEYRKTAKNIAKLQWNYFFKNNTFNKNLDIKKLKSALSERYKQTCQWQVVSILEGFIENVKNEFEKIVYNSKLDNKTKKVLLAINKQINIKENKLDIKLIKEIKPKEYKPETEYIAIDLGLNSLIATDKGDLIGRNFINFLKRLDEKITKRMAYLQRRSIKPRQDRKYRELVRTLQEFLKNEINRYINRLIEIYKPKTIIVEKLDFRNTELSKRLNRLISNFGKRIFKDKLKRLQELYKIEVIEVNPAYTSQTCSRCGYVDKRNRKDTQRFECEACGYKTNAQVNGAINILNRRSIGGIKLHHSKRQVLRVLVKQYFERVKGCNSAPLEVLKGNPYFRDFLEDFLNPRMVENKCL